MGQLRVPRLLNRLLLDRCERLDRRTVQHFAIGRELRAMACAVPALLKTVPVHDAPHVGAGCGAANDPPVLSLIDGDLAEAGAHNGALTAREIVDRADFTRTQIFAEVLDDPGLAAGELTDACG